MVEMGKTIRNECIGVGIYYFLTFFIFNILIFGLNSGFVFYIPLCMGILFLFSSFTVIDNIGISKISAVVAVFLGGIYTFFSYLGESQHDISFSNGFLSMIAIFFPALLVSIAIVRMMPGDAQKNIEKKATLKNICYVSGYAYLVLSGYLSYWFYDFTGLINFFSSLFIGLLLIIAGYFIASNTDKAQTLAVSAALVSCLPPIGGITVISMDLIPLLTVTLPFCLPPFILALAIQKFSIQATREKMPTAPVPDQGSGTQSQQIPSPLPSFGDRLSVPVSPYIPVIRYDKVGNASPAPTNTIPTAEQKTPITLDQVLPYLNQYLKNQKKPLENLEKFYEYLKLKKFDLPPELKEQIKKRIEEAIEEQKNKQREEELGRELFGAPNSPAPMQPGPSGVIPQSSVASGSACQVCLSEFSSAEPGAVKCPHCGNLFHYRCITKWVNKNGTCPICKKELKV